MSDLASCHIGHILTDSGLHDVLVIVYASNVVIRILRGKDIIARALQGHISVCFEDFCDEKRKYRIRVINEHYPFLIPLLLMT